MSHRTVRTGGIVLLSATMALALAACKRADPEKLERGIRSKLEEKWPGSIAAVDCPDGIELKKGNNFSCTVTVKSGGTIQIDVTQQDDDGNVIWKPVASTVLLTEQVETGMQEKLSEQRGGIAVTVECVDAPFLGGSAGATVECTVSAPGEAPVAVTVTQDDVEGSFSWKFKGDAAGPATLGERLAAPDSPPANP